MMIATTLPLIFVQPYERNVESTIRATKLLLKAGSTLPGQEYLVYEQSLQKNVSTDAIRKIAYTRNFGDLRGYVVGFWSVPRKLLANSLNPFLAG